MRETNHPLVSVAGRGTRPAALVAIAVISASALAAIVLSTSGAAAAPDVDPRDRLITTIAGTGEGGATGDGGQARQARLGGLFGVTAGPDGTVYATTDNRIRAITPDGLISAFAGTGEAGDSGDGGHATEAAIDPFDAALAVGPDGTVYFADAENDRVRAIAPDGTIRSVAGNGHEDVTADGQRAAGAPVFNPSDVAVGPDGTLFLAESSYGIRAIAADGTIWTVADGTGDGVIDYFVARVVAVGPDGTVYTVSNTWGEQQLLAVDDGTLVSVADLPGHAHDLAVDANGTVYVVVSGAGLVAVDPLSGEAETVIEDPWPTHNGLGDGGPAADAHVYQPQGVAVGSDGSIYIADYSSGRIRALLPQPAGKPAEVPSDSRDRLVTWAGYVGDELGETGTGSWLAGPTHQLDIALWRPGDVAVAGDGTTYVADTDRQRVVAIDPSSGGVSVTLSEDDVDELRPTALAVHDDKTLYVLDASDDRVLRLDLDGDAIDEIPVAEPSGIAVAADGTAYVGTSDRVICSIDQAAGTCETFIDGGDDRAQSDTGVATDATFAGIRLDLATGPGVLYVADAWWIRAIDLQTGAVTVTAGTGIDGPFVEGAPALSTSIEPSAITVSADGSVYFIDRAQVLRAVTPGGTIRTVAQTDVGVEDEYGADDDPATPAPALAGPLGLGADAKGNVFVADTNHDLIRVVGDLEVPPPRSTAGRNAVLFGAAAAMFVVLGGLLGLARRRRAPAVPAWPRSPGRPRRRAI